MTTALANKFLRTFTLTIQGKTAVHEVTYPATVVFDINRRTFSNLNGARFLVYNLDQSVRNDIYKDPYPTPEDNLPRKVIFEAGYLSQGFEGKIFDGNIKRAISYREGPDIVTEIEGLDGMNAVRETQIERTRSSGWDAATEMRAIAELMAAKGVTLGALGNVAAKIQSTRGVTWSGSVWNILKRLTTGAGGYACIDMSKVYLMDEADAFDSPGNIAQIDASTGLLQTPRRQGAIVDIEMLFEPRITLMQKISVLSKVNPLINGQFVVRGVGHRGTISGAKDGGVTTSLSAFQPTTGLSTVVPE